MNMVNSTIEDYRINTFQTSADNTNVGTVTHTCPHCETVYNQQSTIAARDQKQSHCSHLLCSYESVTKAGGSIYKSFGNLTADIQGRKMPLVIAKRFIRFIRDRKGNTPLTGFYTIHQSKSRVSNTFQGVTSFMISIIPTESSDNSSNNNLKTNGIIKSIESTFYLTLDPNQDLAQLESFILMSYKSNSLPTISKSMNTLVNSNNNQTTVDIILSKEEINNYLVRIDEENDDYYSSENEDVFRWLMVTGFPDQLPHFILLTNSILQNNNNDQFLFSLPISKSNNNEFNIQIIPLVELPKVAAFN